MARGRDSPEFSGAVLTWEELAGRLDTTDSYNPQAIVIAPLLDITDGDDTQKTPAGIDLRLDTRFRRIDTRNQSHIDLRMKQRYHLVELDIDDRNDRYILHPGDFVLGQSLEYVRMPSDLVGRLDGRSSMGRMGLVVHSTASCVDPGFQGHLVFELSNMGNVPIVLTPFVRIARLLFYRASPTAHLYTGKYQFQSSVKPTQPDATVPGLADQPTEGAQL